MIVFRCLWIVVLRSIQFYDQLCVVTIKIRKIYANLVLTLELYGMCFQKIIPQMAFFFGHILSQILGTPQHHFILIHV